MCFCFFELKYILGKLVVSGDIMAQCQEKNVFLNFWKNSFRRFVIDVKQSNSLVPHCSLYTVYTLFRASGNL